MTIDSCEFVYCVAQPGTGKTFNGDYLELVHGFAHIDGDLPFRMAHTPEMRAVITKVIEGGKLHPKMAFENVSTSCSEDLVGLEEYWGPYHETYIDAALEAGKTHKKVVITYANGFQHCREFVMDKLKEGGANHVTLLFLTIDEDTKLEDLYLRTKRQYEAMGSNLEDWAKATGWDGSEGEILSKDVFKKIVMEPGQMGAFAFEGPPSYAKVVDVTKRDVTTLDDIDTALGLQRPVEEGSYEEILKKVLARDIQRDKDTPYPFEIFPEIEKEVEEALAKAKTEDEKDQIKRRASSLISLDLKTAVGRASLFSTFSNSSSSTLSLLSDSTKLKNKRRSSFIRTGRAE